MNAALLLFSSVLFTGGLSATPKPKISSTHSQISNENLLIMCRQFLNGDDDNFGNICQSEFLVPSGARCNTQEEQMQCEKPDFFGRRLGQCVKDICCIYDD